MVMVMSKRKKRTRRLMESNRILQKTAKLKKRAVGHGANPVGAPALHADAPVHGQENVLAGPVLALENVVPAPAVVAGHEIGAGSLAPGPGLDPVTEALKRARKVGGVARRKK